MKNVSIHEKILNKISAKQVKNLGEGVYTYRGLTFKICYDDFYNLNAGPINEDGGLADGVYIIFTEGEDF